MRVFRGRAHESAEGQGDPGPTDSSARGRDGWGSSRNPPAEGHPEQRHDFVQVVSQGPPTHQLCAAHQPLRRLRLLPRRSAVPRRTTPWGLLELEDTTCLTCLAALHPATGNRQQATGNKQQALGNFVNCVTETTPSPAHYHITLQQHPQDQHTHTLDTLTH